MGNGLDVNNTVGLNRAVSHESEAKLSLFIEYILIVSFPILKFNEK